MEEFAWRHIIIKNYSSVQSGGYAIICERFNSIEWGITFSTEGSRVAKGAGGTVGDSNILTDHHNIESSDDWIDWIESS